MHVGCMERNRDYYLLNTPGNTEPLHTQCPLHLYHMYNYYSELLLLNTCELLYIVNYYY